MSAPDRCSASLAYEELLLLIDTQAEEIAHQRSDIDRQRSVLIEQRQQLDKQELKIGNWERSLKDLRNQVESGAIPAEAAVNQISRRNIGSHGLAAELVSRRPGTFT